MALASMEKQYWEEDEESVEVGLKRRHETNRRQGTEETTTDDHFAIGIESIGVITELRNTIPQLINKAGNDSVGLITELRNTIPQVTTKTILTEFTDTIPEPTTKTGIESIGELTAIRNTELITKTAIESIPELTAVRNTELITKAGIESIGVLNTVRNTIPDLISKTGNESIGVITGIRNTIPQRIGKTEILTELPIPRQPLKASLPELDVRVTSSHINGTASNGGITTMQESRHYYTDMYLEPTFQKQPTQEFFCPNCNTCIRKVILRDSESKFVPSPPPVAPEPVVIPRQPEPVVIPQESEPLRCTSCFSFLIPIGSWFDTLIHRKKDHDEDEDETDPLLISRGRGTRTEDDREQDGHKKLDDQNKKGSETTKDQLPSSPSEKLDDQNAKGLDTYKDPLPSARIDGRLGSEAGEEIEEDKADEARRKEEPAPLDAVIVQGKTSDDKKKSGKLSPITEIPSKAKAKDDTKKSDKGPVERDLPISIAIVDDPSAITDAEAPAESGGVDSIEILKSIVYGGLAESITSLSVVTSAAGANVGSLKIIAMALANLIGGLFVIIHNIWDLKAEQARTVLNENEEVDRYHKLLGKKKNFALHATFVLLSFLVFGVEPPLVYGFSFRESGNTDYKILAVAGASFLCISLLALGKAHIQKPSSYHAYLKTLVYYLAIGFAASGVSYVAGDLIGKLLDKLGLFKSESEAAFFLPFNDVSAVNPTRSSY